ncbi:gephyrin-like molybdotransferase Glp [Actibacterium sp. XHP0104]|uniref:molybdopterin molybdotransferase MoeA n=1 Tax=Actibacterium sp. XHP0104 TaxID=2984335 RepID=UPI0021E9AE17|nr:gephyrin-like molybdotransferase Glp [Actibacterium sp. XHP0104]MCV2881566.1 molybdopterin molybdotransferase MoeA [Actibacterium sp. XHP0104]
MTIQQDMHGWGCGCDTAGQGGLISIDAALARISALVQPVAGQEDLPLAAAQGRVLAAPVLARAALPPFDNSAMDGYALRAAALTGDGPWTLPVSDRIAAGQAGQGDDIAANAVRIFTGAPLPPGADAVVMQEHVTRVGDQITLRHAVPAGENIRRAGEEIAHGAQVLAPGARLGARQLGTAAAAGHAHVTVTRRLRVALLITGDEVTQPGHALDPARIWDVNTPLLSTAIAAPDIDLITASPAGDDPDSLRAILADLARRADLVVTTGGISVGEEDHLRPAMRALGADLAFEGVLMKPGKPVSFGRLGGALWLGLPGNPMSAYMCWQIFGTDIVRRLAGASDPDTRRRHVVAGSAIRHRPGRCELRPARLSGHDHQGREVAQCDAATHSARITQLAAADGVVLIPAEADELPAGALLEFIPFNRT